MSTKKLTILSLYTVLALCLYAVESLLPTVPIPGVRLGLTNCVTLILLLVSEKKDAAYVLLARILLVTIFFGQLMSFCYSLAGGLCSLVCMALLVSLLRGRYAFLIGAVGGLVHNLAQLLIAFLFTQTPGVLLYLPYLILSGILTGLFTGFVAGFSAKQLKKLRF